MRKLILNTLLFILPALVLASDAEKIFEEANELFKSNEFSAAIEKYEAIEMQGYKSSELFYNLGNAYYKINKPGKAILNYERALLISTAKSRSDIKYNLDLARENLPDDIEVLPPFFLKRWKENVRQVTSSKGWSILALLFFWLGLGGFVVWLKGESRERRKIGFVVGLALIVFCAIPFYLAIDSLSVEKSSGLAVIMTTEVNLRSAPDEVSTSTLLLHEGTSVELLDQIGEWYKVKLLNGEQGWLPMNALEKV